MSTENIGAGTIQSIVGAEFAKEEGLEPPQNGVAGSQAPLTEDAAPLTPEQLEAAQVRAELEHAMSLSSAGMEDGERRRVSTAGDGEPLTADDAKAERQRQMARAARQREEGAKTLKREEQGVAIQRQEASIKDLVLGSGFLRYFGAIDVCAGLLQRRGEMILGEKATEKLIDMLTALIDEFADDAKKELGRVQSMVEMAREELSGQGFDFVEPKVEKPAMKDEIVIGTRLGLKLYRAVRQFDDSLELMSTLSWNDQIGDREVSNRQHLIKQGLGKIYGFASKTNRSLYNRGTAAPRKTVRRTKAADTVEAAELAAA